MKPRETEMKDQSDGIPHKLVSYIDQLLAWHMSFNDCTSSLVSSFIPRVMSSQNGGGCQV